VRVEQLGELYELTVRLPHLASVAAPGQFAQLRCAEGFTPLLRRPFSVAWTDGDCCGFVVQVVGTGTRLLAAMRPGDVLHALGPLGRGFTIDVSGGVVCVSGGVGCAPFPLLIDHLSRRGVDDITVINGAATAARLYPAERFGRRRDGVRVIEATEDGSRGARGRVTALVDAGLSRRPAAVFACGPNAMLAALDQRFRSGDAAAELREASLEAPMGCGYGTCLGCALPVRHGDATRWELCCSDGPVFPMDAVDWDELMRLPAAHVA